MTEKHESGLTMERWNWPFKTQEERQKVLAYYNKEQKREKLNLKKQIQEMERGLF